MKTRMKKTREHSIYEAVEILNKALAIEEPDIRIKLHGGIEDDDPEGKEFLRACKTFIEAYKKYWMLKKVDVELAL